MIMNNVKINNFALFAILQNFFARSNGRWRLISLGRCASHRLMKKFSSRTRNRVMTAKFVANVYIGVVNFETWNVDKKKRLNKRRF